MESKTWARFNTYINMKFLFECFTPSSLRVSAANEWDVKVNTSIENPYLQATMYYFCLSYKHNSPIFFFRGHGNESANLIGSLLGQYFPLFAHGQR